MYTCIFLCMYACMYVCIYVYICEYERVMGMKDGQRKWEI